VSYECEFLKYKPIRDRYAAYSCFRSNCCANGGSAYANDGVPSKEAAEGTFKAPPFLPYANRTIPERPLWGDSHLHTGLSLDAGLFGNTLLPDQAWRFAKGEQVISSTGQPVRLAPVFRRDAIDEWRMPKRLETAALGQGGMTILACSDKCWWAIPTGAGVVYVQVTRCVAGDRYEQGVIAVVGLARLHEVFEPPKLGQCAHPYLAVLRAQPHATFKTAFKESNTAIGFNP